jgi:ribosomal protein L37E
MKDIVSNCFLCGEHALHVMGSEESQVMQCINCGYTTSTKYMGPREENEEYKKLPDDMKKWSKWENNRTWIPSIIQMPIGMLYPLDVDNMVNHEKEMKWGFAPMIDIPEKERENYPNGQGGFYEKRLDTDNPKIYEKFVDGMVYINEEIKKNSSKVKSPKLPKLKKM